MLEALQNSYLPKFVDESAVALVEECAAVVQEAVSGQSQRDLRAHYITPFMKKWCSRFGHVFWFSGQFVDGGSRLFGRTCFQLRILAIAKRILSSIIYET